MNACTHGEDRLLNERVKIPAEHYRFSEISEGYHDELYGYLEEQGWLNEYKKGKTTVPFLKISANGTTREQQICMTEYIRHQIHHPENTYNARFNDSQLRRSIEDMRAFITSKVQALKTI